MVVSELPFTEISHVGLVDHRRIYGPGFGQAVLLITDVIKRPESRDVGSCGLKARERLSGRAVVVVGVGIQLVLIVESMVDPAGPLNGIDRFDRHVLKDVCSNVGLRNIFIKQCGACRVEALLGNLVIRKD